MSRLLTVAALGSIMLTQYALAYDKPPQAGLAETASSNGLSALPPEPAGKPTLIGGRIAKIDPVRDQFVLDVPGARPIKLLFDVRTQVFRDGVKLAPGDLHTGNRASVETVLDGTNVFALSVHMLTRPPVGECQGQVVKFDARTRELTLSSALSQKPLKLLMLPDTPIVREDNAVSSALSPTDLMAGTLVAVKFEPDNQGRGVASQISVLATPGATLVIRGNISSLDLHAGRLVLEDATEDKSYQLSFDPAHIPLSRDLHLGESVRVTASFDGVRYVASAIDVS